MKRQFISDLCSLRREVYPYQKSAARCLASQDYFVEVIAASFVICREIEIIRLKI